MICYNRIIPDLIMFYRVTNYQIFQLSPISCYKRKICTFLSSSPSVSENVQMKWIFWKRAGEKIPIRMWGCLFLISFFFQKWKLNSILCHYVIENVINISHFDSYRNILDLVIFNRLTNYQTFKLPLVNCYKSKIYIYIVSSATCVGCWFTKLFFRWSGYLILLQRCWLWKHVPRGIFFPQPRVECEIW